MNLVPMFTLAAAKTEESADLLGMLGIDIQTLIFQIIAFLILVFALSKWVYPVFVDIIDKREADIEASAKAADEAKKAAESAGHEVDELLAQARREASEIVSNAKTEAGSIVAAAEDKAKSKAESIVASAHAEIEKEISSARKSLHNDMIDLVTQATEVVLSGVASKKDIDSKLVEKAVKEGSK